ncbi:TetR/AcrR family transcriptional regulator [Sphingomonas alpina]|uniref:WHG domain-containing protein n=1 Tax=Sphingomonas alpina TaxID=653931 RepID=A0A7H0LHE6_9SPHN|nr:TetR-like C-terminal domain-containing protein [Sphingomonas alpina]QNQ09099.1 WHG domain-containing protein [Sphingomonas alpina]
MVRAGLTTERLVLAGAALADEAGFDAVTPSTLAKRFDVKVASLYSHVAGAHDLKRRVALLALDELAGLAADAVAGRSGKGALVALANVHRDFARDHPGLFAATRFPLDSETAAASGGVRLAQMIRAVLRGYDLAEPEQTHAVRLLGSVFLGFVTLELGGSFSHSAPEPQESWGRTLDALDAVLRHWPQVSG